MIVYFLLMRSPQQMICLCRETERPRTSHFWLCHYYVFSKIPCSGTSDCGRRMRRDDSSLEILLDQAWKWSISLIIPWPELSAICHVTAGSASSVPELCAQGGGEWVGRTASHNCNIPKT